MWATYTPPYKPPNVAYTVGYAIWLAYHASLVCVPALHLRHFFRLPI